MSDRPVLNTLKVVLVSFAVAAALLLAYHQLFHAKQDGDIHAEPVAPATG